MASRIVVKVVFIGKTTVRKYDKFHITYEDGLSKRLVLRPDTTLGKLYVRWNNKNNAGVLNRFNKIYSGDIHEITDI